MVNRLAIGLILFLATLSAWAQVTVGIATEQNQFLPNQTLIVSVLITNQSGQVLKLGAASDWLQFSIDSREHPYVRSLAPVPVLGEFDLVSAKFATKRVDLAPYFDLTQPGRYVITAIVKIPEWGQEVTSDPKSIDIVSGGRLWEQDFGVPGTGTNGPPEMRKYVLEQARLIQSEIRLYARVASQTESKVYGVVPIGLLVSFSRPEVQVDKNGNLHVLQQSGRASFSYHVISPDGVVIIQRIYEYSNTRPVLYSGNDGVVFVHGGNRKFMPSDLPPAELIPRTYKDDGTATVPDLKSEPKK